MRTPDVLTPEEITALPAKLPEPLRTACELDAFTGLRRGELIGLQWQDVDFENLVIHVRRSVVLMVAGTPKTEASAKDVPLDTALAESLLKLKLVGTLQPGNGLGVRFGNNERQAAAMAGDAMASVWSPGSASRRHLEAGRVPHVPTLCRIRHYAESRF